MKNQDLNGAAPDTCDTALLLIDVINDLRFPDADDLLTFALPMVPKLRRLKIRARQAGIPIIYINDNFGRWQSNFPALVKHCLRSRGRALVNSLRPGPADYFVLKPKHSAFYSTTLDLLLRHLGARRLVITGIAGNICVLFTANDAHMRDFRLCVPSDCICSQSHADNEFALKQMRKVLGADIRPSEEIEFRKNRRPVARGKRGGKSR